MQSLLQHPLKLYPKTLQTKLPWSNELLMRC